MLLARAEANSLYPPACHRRMSTKRNVRMRREYLYKKQLESNEAVQFDKKRKLKQVPPPARSAHPPHPHRPPSPNRRALPHGEEGWRGGHCPPRLLTLAELGAAVNLVRAPTLSRQLQHRAVGVNALTPPPHAAPRRPAQGRVRTPHLLHTTKPRTPSGCTLTRNASHPLRRSMRGSRSRRSCARRRRSCATRSNLRMRRALSPGPPSLPSPSTLEQSSMDEIFHLGGLEIVSQMGPDRTCG